MIKPSLLVLMLALGLSANAQYCGYSGTWICNPDTNSTAWFSPGYDSLPCVVQGTPFSAHIGVVVPPVITVDGIAFPILSLSIESIQNLPCGLCWSTNSWSNTFYAGTSGCLIFTGTSSDLAGQYKLNITATVYTLLGAYTGVDLSTFGVNYYLRVSNDSVGCSPVDTTALGNLACTNPATISPVAGVTQVCAGSSINIPFSVTGSFSPLNVFTAQLSNAWGGFNNPTVIGTLQSNTSGNITGVIPVNTSPGLNYRIRITSSEPVISGDYGSYITIHPAPAGPLLSSSGGCPGNAQLSVNSLPGVSGLSWYINNSFASSVLDSVFTTTTAAGGNGVGASYNQLNSPYGIFVDGAGNMFVADPGNNRVLKFPPGSSSLTNGEVVAGGNGAGSAANQLNAPYFIFVDRYENLYVSDCNNYRVQKFPPGSNSSTNGVTIAGGNGTGNAYNQIGFPRGVFVDGHHNLFVADKTNDRILKFPAGSDSATNGVIVAGGNGPGAGSNQLNGPRGIWLDTASNLYVADYSNSRIQWFPAGSDSTTDAITIAGGNGQGSLPNQLNQPYGVFVDAAGNTYVADVYNNRVQKFPAGSNSSTFGVTVAGGNGAGNASNQLNEPSEVFVDANGSIFTVDEGNNRVQKTSVCLFDTVMTALSPGNYTAVYTTPAGCVSVPSNSVTVNPATSSNIAQTICAGDSYLGRTEAGVYVDTLENAYGCDSVRTLYLSVNPLGSGSIYQTICPGDSYLGRNSAGVYTDTLTGFNGCDSIRTLYLTINTTGTSDIYQTVCQGDSYLGRSSTGVYMDTLTGWNGCDSLRTLYLTVNATGTSDIYQTICPGDSYLGRTATGVYTDTLTGWNGCDSLRTLYLTVNTTGSSVVDQTICQGDSYLGRSASGIYVDTLTGGNGCDSIRTLNLLVNPVAVSYINQSICAGSSYPFNGQLYPFG